MSAGERPSYPEKARTTCPRCDSDAINALPANNPGSHQEWFLCIGCNHMWSQRRDRTDECEPPHSGSAGSTLD